jgi:hypothetical protein
MLSALVVIIGLLAVVAYLGGLVQGRSAAPQTSYCRCSACAAASAQRSGQPITDGGRTRGQRRGEPRRQCCRRRRR